MQFDVELKKKNEKLRTQLMSFKEYGQPIPKVVEILSSHGYTKGNGKPLTAPYVSATVAEHYPEARRTAEYKKRSKKTATATATDLSKEIEQISNRILAMEDFSIDARVTAVARMKGLK